MAEPLLMEKANQLEKAGNVTMAAELRAGAAYATECLKIYGQNTLAQFSKDTVGLFGNSLIPELRQIGVPQKESVAHCEPEQKYKDVVQELCAKAGCKTGSILHQVCISLIVHGLGRAIQSLPPIIPLLVGADGVAVVPVANTVAMETEVAGSIVLMSGARGSGGDMSGSHSEAPQAPGDEKQKPAVAPAGVKDQAIITGYTETAVNYEHIFSDKHMKRGIMGLSKLADEKIAKSEIVRIFQSIVKDADRQGLLKAGGTNIIRTVINDLEAEIKFDILPDGTIRSFDGYIGRTEREWFNMVTCDYKGV
jgi:hypothetical protein